MNDSTNQTDQQVDGQGAADAAQGNMPGQTARPRKPTLVTADVADLLLEHFDPPCWIIEGQLGEGLTVFVAPPKLGKSLVALGRALLYAIQQTGDQGHEVLYISLDDRNKRRFRDRSRSILQDRALPKGRFSYAMEAPSLSEGFVPELGAWLNAHPKAGLVIVDIYAAIKPRNKGNDVVKGDYDSMVGLRDLAYERHIGVLLLHHTRKGVDTEDWVRDISGSFGIAGGTDGLWKLERHRNGRVCCLRMTHRDMLADSVVDFDLDDDLMAPWTPRPAAKDEATKAPDETVGQTTKAIIGELDKATTCLWPRQIAKGSKLNEATVRSHLRRMMTRREVEESPSGAYMLPGRCCTCTCTNMAVMPPDATADKRGAAESSQDESPHGRSCTCTHCKVAVIEPGATAGDRGEAGNIQDNLPPGWSDNLDNGHFALCDGATPGGQSNGHNEHNGHYATQFGLPSDDVRGDES